MAATNTIVAIATIGLVGCFDPRFREGIECGPAASCPSGLTCTTDNVCRTTASLGDGSIEPDAIQCGRNADCAEPPGHCLLAGRCNLDIGLCEFDRVDCSGLDAECTRGVCRESDGECVAEAASEGESCGAGTSCDSFGPCDYASVCDQSASQARSCIDNVCRAGACTLENREDLLPCVRDTEGLSCGAAVPSGCGACDMDCLRVCTCTTPTCAAGGCTGTDVAECTVSCPGCTPI